MIELFTLKYLRCIELITTLIILQFRSNSFLSSSTVGNTVIYRRKHLLVFTIQNILPSSHIYLYRYNANCRIIIRLSLQIIEHFDIRIHLSSQKKILTLLFLLNNALSRVPIRIDHTIICNGISFIFI